MVSLNYVPFLSYHPHVIYRCRRLYQPSFLAFRWRPPDSPAVGWVSARWLWLLALPRPPPPRALPPPPRALAPGPPCTAAPLAMAICHLPRHLLSAASLLAPAVHHHGPQATPPSCPRAPAAAPSAAAHRRRRGRPRLAILNACTGTAPSFAMSEHLLFFLKFGNNL